MEVFILILVWALWKLGQISELLIKMREKCKAECGKQSLKFLRTNFLKAMPEQLVKEYKTCSTWPCLHSWYTIAQLCRNDWNKPIQSQGYIWISSKQLYSQLQIWIHNFYFILLSLLNRSYSRNANKLGTRQIPSFNCTQANEVYLQKFLHLYLIFTN